MQHICYYIHHYNKMLDNVYVNIYGVAVVTQFCPFGLTNVNKQTVVIVGQLKVISIKTPEKIWPEKKNAEHFDRNDLSSEKERQIFAQIDHSDMICEEEHNYCEFMLQNNRVWVSAHWYLVYQMTSHRWQEYQTVAPSVTCQLTMQ